MNMRTDKNPFNYPDIDRFQLSNEHALATGRIWRFGVRKTLTANGGQLILALQSKADKLEFRNARLTVKATSTPTAITEIRYEIFKDCVFDINTGTDLPVYPLNFNVQYPEAANAPIYKQDPTVTNVGVLAAPVWRIDAPGRSIGNINEDALSILEPNKQYLVRITNDDTTDEHTVDFYATFSFPPV